MQLRLDDIALFMRIVDLGTLSAAARERDMPVSQVTRMLVRLEVALGVRLLHRSTHGLSLTDEGDTFIAHGRRLLDTAAELQGELSGKRGGPGGWVRLSVSPVLAQAVITPSLPSLYLKHPQLHLDICADDRIVDMVREGIDVALRTGSTQTDTVVARQIAVLGRGLYAAPAYVAAFGMPDSPDDLGRHRLIGNSANPTLNRWSMATGQGTREWLVDAHTRTDNTAVMLSLVLEGVGIARLADLVALPLVRSGALVPVLPGRIEVLAVPMYAVMLQERHRLPKVRAVIDHLAEWMQRWPADVTSPAPPLASSRRSKRR